MKYPSLPALCRRPLVAVAVAALAFLASAGVGQAQDQQAVPAAPAVTLRSCDAGCLIVDAGALAYTDGSALALPQDGAYALSGGGNAPLIEVQWRRTGATQWVDWNHVADDNVHWGVRRSDVSGHLEVRGLRDGSSYDVRARVRDPNDPANAVSDWSTVTSAAPAAWPGVTALRADVGRVTGSSQHDERYALYLSWTAPSGGPAYSGYYVSATHVYADDFACHNELNPGRWANEQWAGLKIFNNALDNEFVTAASAEVAAELEINAGDAYGPLRICVSPAVGPASGRQVAQAQAAGSVPGVAHSPQAWRDNDGVHRLAWHHGHLADGDITASQWRYHTGDLVPANGHFVENWTEPVTVAGPTNETVIEFPAAPKLGDLYIFSVRSKSATGWGAWSNTGAGFRSSFNHPPTVDELINDLQLQEAVMETSSLQQAHIDMRGVFSDYDGHYLAYSAQSSDDYVARVALSHEPSLTVYAEYAGEAVITVTASDGHGGTAQDQFKVTVVDPFDPWVYDIDDSGRIDEFEWRQAKSDYSACATWVSQSGQKPDDDAVARIGCYGELGKPYLNLMRVRDTHAERHVRVYVTWGGVAAGADGDAVVSEDVGAVQLRVRRHLPAPAGGATYNLLIAGNSSGATDADISLSSSQVTIPEGHHEASATLTVVDDDIDESKRRRGQSDIDPDAHETFTITAVSPDGVALGRVLLSIRDNDSGVSFPLERCDRDEAVCNARPQASGLADLLLLSERDTVQVDLADAFTDPDGEALTLAVRSSDEAVVTVSLTGATLLVNPHQKGTALITVTAQDASGGDAANSFSVTVRSAPELVAELADIDDMLKDQSRNIDVSGVFNDPDGGVLIHEAGSSHPAIVAVAQAGTQLTVRALQPGTATVTVTAIDDDANRTDATFTVEVLNRVPVAAKTLGTVTLPAEGVSRQVSLAGLFADADGDAITLSATSSTPTVASASVQGERLTLTAVAWGTATVTVAAHDGRGGTGSVSFAVTVKAAPVVASPLADVTGLVEQTTRDIDVSAVFSDRDGDALTYAVSSSDDERLYAAVWRDYPLLTLLGEQAGTVTVTLTATDSDENSVQDAFTVTVTAAPPEPEPDNAPPVIAYYLGDETLINESDSYGVWIDGVFDDPEGGALTVTATSSDAGVVAASVSTDQNTLTLKAQSRGKATVTVTATDGRGGRVSQEFRVTVKAAPTVAAPVADIADLEDGGSRDVDTAGVFNDPDDDRFRFWTDSADDSVAWASVSGDGATLTVVGESLGTVVITLLAEDADGNQVSDSFSVTVVKPEPADGGAEVSCDEEHYRHTHDGGDHWHSFIPNEHSGKCDHSVGRLSGSVNYHEH